MLTKGLSNSEFWTLIDIAETLSETAVPTNETATLFTFIVYGFSVSFCDLFTLLVRKETLKEVSEAVVIVSLTLTPAMLTTASESLLTI